MEIFNNPGKAYKSAMRRFLRQQSNDLIYICRAVMARKEFWVVLSTIELRAYKISPKSCWTAIDGNYGLQELKEAHKQDAKYRLAATAIRSYERFKTAQEKLKKMERGADAPERLPELDTQKA